MTQETRARLRGEAFRVDFLKTISFKLKNKVCDSCSKARHTWSPFSLSQIRTKECFETFELIHCDVRGKYCTPSLSGAKYFLTIVDDYSMYVWIFLIKHKNDVFKCLSTFIKW